MNTFEIKHRFSSAVLFSCELPEEIAAQYVSRQLGYAVKEAIKARADLAGAYLAGADLARADLAGADLARADLAGAYLADANLAGADLAGADLAGAYLADADLAGADLAGAYLADAYLADAYNVPETNGSEATEPYERAITDEQRAARYAKRSAKFRERNPDVPVIEQLDAKILAAVENGAGKLDMSRWHSCQTTHCRAGWAITLAGDAGKALEEKYGPHHAGRMLYIASTGRVPHFFADNAGAMEDMRACAAGAAL
jgi:hypothetical protein